MNMFQCFGSQCTMFLQSIYDYIEHKLKLIPMAISGIGVDSRHLMVEGITYLNLQPKRDGTFHTEPVSISSKSPYTKSGEQMKITLCRESKDENSSAFVELARTTIITKESTGCVKAKFSNTF